MKNYYRRSYALALTFALFLTYNSPLFSQNQPQKTISGIITDGAAPLSGVNVLVKNSARGSISDLEGRYSVIASSTDTLVFTYLGYKPLEVAVGNAPILNVVMEVDAQALDAVVINAGYYKVSDRERTGSIARVTAEEIENQPVDNPLAALQGRIAGVNIVPLTGVPGGGYNVSIRGQNSIAAGNEPLYIVDGLPYNSTSLSDQSLSGAILPGGQLSPLSLINPNDIESVEILKDADATAIYGSRGANGVILITTKKGKAGVTTFNVTATSGIAHYGRTLETLKTEDYLRMRREAFANDGITEYPESAYDVNGTWNPNRYTDWQEELLGGTAEMRTLEASVQGGGENTSFLISAGNRTETTVFPDDANYERTTFRNQLNHHSKDRRFTLAFSGGYTIEANELPSIDPSLLAIEIPPNAPALYTESGELNFENSTFDNPLAPLNSRYSSNRNVLMANMELSYQLFKNLYVKSGFGYQDSRLEEYRTYPSTVYDPAFGLDSSVSSIYRNQGKRNSWIVEPQISYTHSFLGGDLNILIGGSFQNEENSTYSQLAIDFPSNDLLFNLAAANEKYIRKDETTKYKYEAVFGRINYNYLHKYILNLTGRRDGSSRFGTGKRLANFGAIGAAWVFGEESLFKENLSFISFGKIRGSYGTTGNDRIGDYQYLDTYTVTGIPYNGTIGMAPTQLFNPDFGWEINKKVELALELGFVNDRIFLETNYYRNRSSSQLVGIPLPATTGFESIQSNLDALVENTGWEFTLNSTPVKTEILKWNIGLNLTLPKNELLEFPGLEASTYSNQYVIGEPLTLVKLFHYTGVDPQTGLYQFEDYDGDGEINYGDDQQYVEDTAPSFYGGLQNSVTFHNWELAVFLQFSKQKGYNYWYAASPAGAMVNQPIAVLDHWQQPGDSGPTQLYTSGENYDAINAFYLFSSSNAAFSDASYVRLKNVSLGYTLPLSGLKCKVFVEGQNLLTLTSFKGGDPEQLTGFLPPLCRYSGGIQVSF
jgi:TonB-linked SusC/RagA family outer membrane protein